ncbi:dihydrofolate reductase [Algiphilus sp.]|uniref:dihydrofolate reductase n=1 Tax=Algiphilus sp. TaxID=1872431 RepID=UPI003B52CE26
MEITLLLAMDDTGLIGANGQLPWRLPNDLKRFRRQTLGRTIVMGRSTFDSIGRPLDGRNNWVLTTNRSFSAAGVRCFHDIDSILAERPENGLAIIGGATLYEQFMPLATRIELTRVHATLSGDTWFSDPALAAWKAEAVEVEQPDERHAHAYSFLSLTRR